MHIFELTKTHNPTAIFSSNFRNLNPIHQIEPNQKESRAGQRRLRTETQISSLALQSAIIPFSHPTTETECVYVIEGPPGSDLRWPEDYLRGDYKKALEKIDRLLLNNDFALVYPSFHFAKANCLALLGDYEKALQGYTLAKDSHYHLVLEKLYKFRPMPAALTYFLQHPESTIADLPFNPIHLPEWRLFLKIYRPDETIVFSPAFIKEDPLDPVFSSAQRLFQEGRYRETIELLSLHIAKGNGYISASYSLIGICYALLGDNESALDYCTESDDDEPWQNALIHYLNGDFQRTKTLLGKGFANEDPLEAELLCRLLLNDTLIETPQKPNSYFDDWFFQTSYGKECKDVLEAVQVASIPLNRDLVARFIRLCEAGGYYNPYEQDEDESGQMYGARSEKLVEMGMLHHWLGDMDKSAVFISRSWQEGNPLAYVYGKCHPELWTNCPEPSPFTFEKDNEYYDWPYIPQFLSLFDQGKWVEALQLGSSRDDIGYCEGPILQHFLLKEMELSKDKAKQWSSLLDDFDEETFSEKISFHNLDRFMNHALKKLAILARGS